MEVSDAAQTAVDGQSATAITSSATAAGDTAGNQTSQASVIAETDKHPAIDEADEGDAYEAETLLVSFDGSVSDDEIGEHLAAVGFNTYSTVVTSDDVVSGGTTIVEVTVPAGTTVAQAATTLAELPQVAYAQPNYCYTVASDDASTGETSVDKNAAAAILDAVDSVSSTELVPETTSINDTYASSQWALSSVGLYDAWDIEKTNGAVTVAILDMGITADHDDLKDNIVAPYNSATKTAGTAAVVDNSSDGHGTHVAGIVAAEANNDIGVAGASYNAHIMPIKVATDSGSITSTTLLVAYNYLFAAAVSDANSDGQTETNAKEYNVKVVNISIGRKDTNGSVSSSDNFLKYGMDAAYTQGILTVCAAGNSGSGVVPYDEYPGDYDTCVSVINLTSSNTRALSSNYNTEGTTETTVNHTKDISAPGTSILSTLNTYKNQNSSVDSGGYYYGPLSGTSMASPLVAGIAALLFAYDPSLTCDQAKTVLYSTATDLGDAGWDREFGYGKVNAYAALEYLTQFNLENATVTIPDQGYTGSAITPTPVVTIGDKTLTLGTDYTVSYSDDTVNAGTVTVTITATGTNLYFGTSTATFQILPASISTATIDAIPSQTYTGSAKMPDLTVTYKGKALIASTDYTVEYENNVNAGTATATVTGIGNYTGSPAVVSFTIVPADISTAAVAAIPDQTYTGNAIIPSLTVTLGGKVLTQGADYTVACTNATDIGTATVTVTGAGNYTGTITPASSFRIVPITWTRLSGENRVETMAAIVDKGFADGACSGKALILTTAYNYADALSASGLAGVLGCPIITTDGSTLSAAAIDEIARLNPSTVYILGGTGSVSEAEAISVADIFGVENVIRIGGAGRIDTDLMICALGTTAGEAGTNGWSDTCIVTKGYSFADALSIAPYAYAAKCPVFLASSDGTLTPEVQSAIKSGHFENVIVLGGTASSDSIQDSTISALGFDSSHILRLSGSNRQATSQSIAIWAMGEDASAVFQPSTILSYDSMAVADAWGYPDALASIGLLGPAKSVLLLVDDSEDTQMRIVDFFSERGGKMTKAYILGGTSTVDVQVESWLNAAM